MKEIEKRIYVNNDVVLHEYELTYGERKNEEVVFEYYNFVKDKEGGTFKTTYKKAIELAKYRRNDKRYKNYEFLIYTKNL